MAIKPEDMRARFREAGDEREAILAKIAPLQKKRDALAAKIAAIEVDIRPIEAELKIARAPLYDLDMERGALVRALKGKTGDPATEAKPEIAEALETAQNA